MLLSTPVEKGQTMRGQGGRKMEEGGKGIYIRKLVNGAVLFTCFAKRMPKISTPHWRI